MSKITKELLEELKDENTLTIKRKKDIFKLINDKVDKIFKCIIEKTGGKYRWYAYDNDIEYGNGDGSSGGEFDLKRYSEHVYLTGDFNFNDKYANKEKVNVAFPFYEGFPTYLLLVENYEDEIYELLKQYEDECEKVIRKNKEREDNKLKEKDNIIATIKSKLSKEELKYIKFK